MISQPLRFAALTVALVALGVALAAQDRAPGAKGCPGSCDGPGAGPGFHRGGKEGFRGMNLSEAQKTQFKALHERHQKTLENKQEAAHTAGQALHEAMGKDADVKSLRALHDKASAAQFDLLLEHRALRQEILPLLTPEQKAKFEKMPMGMMGPGMGMGPGGPGMGPHMGPGRGMERGMGHGMGQDGHGHPGPDGQPPKNCPAPPADQPVK